MSTPDEINKIREQNLKYNGCISAGATHTVGLKSDGTVIATGYKNKKISDWRDVVAISCAIDTVGLRADGTLVLLRDHTTYVGFNSKYFKNLVAVSADWRNFIVGLKPDGTVISSDMKKCNTESWKDIISVSSGGLNTIGLKSDGTVVGLLSLTDNWCDIVAISTGCYHTVGLKKDGTVIAVGVVEATDDGQCNTDDWNDIVAISAGGYHTVGLKTDGTVIAVGSNGVGQCNTKEWRNIVAISAGANHTVGLKANGTVVAVGGNRHNYTDEYGNEKTVEDGRCNVNEWQNIGAVDKDQILTQLQNRAKGICIYCGGKMSGVFTKKCQSCKKTN